MKFQAALFILLQIQLWVLRRSAHHILCSCSELGQYLIATYHALQWSWSWSCRVATVFKNHLYTMFYLMVSCILYSWCWVTLIYEFHYVMTEQICFSVGSSKILHKHCPYMHRYVSLCVAVYYVMELSHKPVRNFLVHYVFFSQDSPC